jgi:hypothetical protein
MLGLFACFFAVLHGTIDLGPHRPPLRRHSMS